MAWARPAPIMRKLHTCQNLNLLTSVYRLETPIRFQEDHEFAMFHLKFKVMRGLAVGDIHPSTVPGMITQLQTLPNRKLRGTKFPSSYVGGIKGKVT